MKINEKADFEDDKADKHDKGRTKRIKTSTRDLHPFCHRYRSLFLLFLLLFL